MSSLEFAVVDVETTGLFPGMKDRILELAVIRLDSDGEVVETYTTLVNPDRDVGPTHKHGIRAGDIANAPRFSEVAGYFLEILSGTILVAHVADFDWRFIRAELELLGCAVPDASRICTRRLSSLVGSSTPSQRLEDLCRHFGIQHEESHSALGDAKATAGLFLECIRRIRSKVGTLRLSDLGVVGELVSPQDWPKYLSQGRHSYTREDAEAERAERPCYIADLVARMPLVASGGSLQLKEYLNLLDRVLEDRRVSLEETDWLRDLAEDIGLPRSEAEDGNREYLKDLVQVALEDGIITNPEREDLEEVRGLLGISEPDFYQILDETTNRISANDLGVGARRSKPNLEGSTVCFTGTLNCCIDGERANKPSAERLAAAKGMIVKKNISKGLDYLVAADPDSMSGKARKAHEFGVRVVAEPVFWRMIGVDIG